MVSTIGLMYNYLQCAAKLTSPKAPLPIALIGSKSSTPNLDLFNLKNSVSLVACCCRLSSFYNHILSQEVFIGIHNLFVHVRYQVSGKLADII